MITNESITVTVLPETKYLGVYDNAGTWTQSTGGCLATNLAVLDSIAIGTISGTIYEDTDVIEDVNKISISVTAKPPLPKTYTGTLTTDTDATVEATSSVTVTATNPYDSGYADLSDINEKILSQDKQ